MKSGLGIIYALSFIKAFLVHTTWYFLPIHLYSIGMNGMEIGLLTAMFSITGLLLIVPMGMLSDKLSSRSLLWYGHLGLVLTYSLFSQADSLFYFALAYLIFGFAINMVDSSLNAFVLKSAQSTDSGKIMGRYNFSRTFSMGIGMLAGASLVEELGFSALFLFAAVFFAFLAFLSRFLPLNTTYRASVRDYKEAFFQREILIFCATIFFYAFHWGAESTCYSLFLRENLKLSMGETGLFLSIPIMILGLTSLLVGKRLEKNPEYRGLLRTGIFLSGAFMIAMTWPLTWFSFLMRLVHEIGDAIVLTIILYGQSRFFDSSKAGGLGGLFRLITIVASSTGSLILSPLGQSHGYDIAMMIAGAVGLLPLLLHGILSVRGFIQGQNSRISAAQNTPL